MWGSRDPILEFWDPLISRERLKLETSNLALRRTALSSNERNSKLGQKSSCGGQVTQFWNFGILLISRERLKLETLNLKRWRMAMSWKFKIGSKGVMWGHVTQFWNFGTPLISRERLKLETSNLARRLTAVSSNEKKFKILSKGVMCWSRDSIFEFWVPLNISGTVKPRNFKFDT